MGRVSLDESEFLASVVMDSQRSLKYQRDLGEVRKMT
jgi:hypothetical protein